MAKKTEETSSKAKGDIDFEKELWNVANELRGAVAENQYKDYVLSLIFLKHMSERYEVRRDELEMLVNEPKSEYYTKNKKEQEAILKDEDEYTSRNTYIVPKKATWQYLQDNAEQDDIKVKVDDAFELLENTITKFRPELKGVLPRIFVKSQLTSKQLGGLINLFSNKKFSEKYNPESDVLGRIYEYYIGRFAIAEGSGAGQFFTPGCIVRLDKVMTGHTLMQAIARTNRVFKDKNGGVIVDYIGIGDQLKAATEKYTQGGGRDKPTIDMEQALEMFYNQVDVRHQTNLDFCLESVLC